jgi:polysaccharide biosynthesis protein PelE
MNSTAKRLQQQVSESPAWDWHFFGITLFSLFLELLLVLSICWNPRWIGWGMIVHILWAVVLGGWAYRAPRAVKDRRFPWLLALWTPLTGPIGAGGCLLTLFLACRYRRAATRFEDWYASLFPELEMRHPQLLVETIERSGSAGSPMAEVLPFTDVLSFGTKEEKLEAIIRMTRKFQPGFAPLLKQALNDPINAVRVQAAAAITKIENDFLNESERLAREAKERPDDPDLLREIGRYCDNYAFTGLLDSLREQDNRVRALSAYRDYLRHVPGDWEIRLAAGRILMRQGDYRQAVGWFEDSLAAGCAIPQMVLWLMEALSRLGRYEEVRELARRYRLELQDETEFSAEIIGAVRLWAGEALPSVGRSV